MLILMWVMIGVFVVALLFGLKDWIFMFIESWYSNGKKFTIFFLIFILLLCTPAVVKDFLPQYYDYVLVLMFLSFIFFLGYGFAITKGFTRDEEDD